MTKEEIIAKHFKAQYEHKYNGKRMYHLVLNDHLTSEWLLNAMDEWAEMQVNKNLHKPAVMELVCDECKGWGYTVDENGRRKAHCTKCD